MDEWNSEWFNENAENSAESNTFSSNFNADLDPDIDGGHNSSRESMEDDAEESEEKNEPVIKPSLIGITQAKKRLKAFSAAKLVKKVVKEDKALNNDKNENLASKKSKKELYPDEKARAVIEEIEEIKKMEAKQEQLKQERIAESYKIIHSMAVNRERSLSPDGGGYGYHFKRREIKARNIRQMRSRSASPKDRKKKKSSKMNYPKNWSEYFEQKLTITKDEQLKSKLFSSKKPYPLDMFHMLYNFHTPSPKIEPFVVNYENSVLKLPTFFVRFTKTNPPIQYSVNTKSLKESYLTRKQLFELVSRDRRELIEKLINAPPRPAVGKILKERKWYNKIWKKLGSSEARPVENSVGLSFLQTYSDDENEANDDEEIIICSSIYDNEKVNGAENEGSEIITQLEASKEMLEMAEVSETKGHTPKSERIEDMSSKLSRVDKESPGYNMIDEEGTPNVDRMQGESPPVEMKLYETYENERENRTPEIRNLRGETPAIERTKGYTPSAEEDEMLEPEEKQTALKSEEIIQSLPLDDGVKTPDDFRTPEICSREVDPVINEKEIDMTRKEIEQLEVELNMKEKIVFQDPSKYSTENKKSKKRKKKSLTGDKKVKDKKKKKKNKVKRQEASDDSSDTLKYKKKKSKVRDKAKKLKKTDTKRSLKKTSNKKKKRYESFSESSSEEQIDSVPKRKRSKKKKQKVNGEKKEKKKKSDKEKLDAEWEETDAEMVNEFIERKTDSRKNNFEEGHSGTIKSALEGKTSADLVTVGSKEESMTTEYGIELKLNKYMTRKSDRKVIDLEPIKIKAEPVWEEHRRPEEIEDFPLEKDVFKSYPELNKKSPSWESDEDVSPLKSRTKLNTSWESDDEDFHRIPVVPKVSEAKTYNVGSDFEIPLNIKPFKRRGMLEKNNVIHDQKNQEEKKQLEGEKEKIEENIQIDVENIVMKVNKNIVCDIQESDKKVDSEEKKIITPKRGRWDKREWVAKVVSTPKCDSDSASVHSEKNASVNVIDLTSNSISLENEYEEFLKAVTSTVPEDTEKSLPISVSSVSDVSEPDSLSFCNRINDSSREENIPTISSRDFPLIPTAAEGKGIKPVPVPSPPKINVSKPLITLDLDIISSIHSNKVDPTKISVDRGYTTFCERSSVLFSEASIETSNVHISNVPNDDVAVLTPSRAAIDKSKPKSHDANFDISMSPLALKEGESSTHSTLSASNTTATEDSFKNVMQICKVPVVCNFAETPNDNIDLSTIHLPPPIIKSTPQLDIETQKVDELKLEPAEEEVQRDVVDQQEPPKNPEKQFMFTGMVLQTKKLLLDKSKLNFGDSDDEEPKMPSLKKMEDGKKMCSLGGPKTVLHEEKMQLDQNKRAVEENKGSRDPHKREEMEQSTKIEKKRSRSRTPRSSNTRGRSKEKERKRDSPSHKRRRTPSPRSRRRGSPSKWRDSPKRGSSPRRRSPGRRRSLDKKRLSRRTPSPRRGSVSSTRKRSRKSTSPRKQSMSPRKRGGSPRRRSPSPRKRPSSPKRKRSPSPRRKSPRRNSSPKSSTKKLRSKSPEHVYTQSRPKSPEGSPPQGLKRSIADSTISDDLLPQPNVSFDDYVNSPSFFDRKSVDSPHRIPLDERINQVLGNTKEQPRVTSTYDNYGNYNHGSYTEQKTGYEGYQHSSNYVQVGNMLQILPTELPAVKNQMKSVKSELDMQSQSRSDAPHPKPSIIQVGNMLQIVPTTLDSSVIISQMTPTMIPPQVVSQPASQFAPQDTATPTTTVSAQTTPRILSLPLPPQESPKESRTAVSDVIAVAATAASTAIKQSAEETMQQKVAERRAEREVRKQQRERKRQEKERKRKEKEKRRQIKLKMRTENMIKRALQLEVEGSLDEEESSTLNETPVQWPPISLICSTPKDIGKGILTGRGKGKNEKKSSKTNKIVKFADGVKPGEGTSPSGGEEYMSPPPKKLPKEKRYTKTNITGEKNKKKKVKVKIIKKPLIPVVPDLMNTDSDSEYDDLPPPSPPPGSPPSHVFPPRVKPPPAPNNVNPYAAAAALQQMYVAAPLGTLMMAPPPPPPPPPLPQTPPRRSPQQQSRTTLGLQNHRQQYHFWRSDS